ncbi:MAG TPA: hypothetical protein DEB39_16455 [Planctomycetaceae bacterium]|nr:hypothetical protein [Planctomycetaceae bacterium]
MPLFSNRGFNLPPHPKRYRPVVALVALFVVVSVTSLSAEDIGNSLSFMTQQAQRQQEPQPTGIRRVNAEQGRQSVVTAEISPNVPDSSVVSAVPNPTSQPFVAPRPNGRNTERSGVSEAPAPLHALEPVPLTAAKETRDRPGNRDAVVYSGEPGPREAVFGTDISGTGDTGMSDTGTNETASLENDGFLDKPFGTSKSNTSGEKKTAGKTGITHLLSTLGGLAIVLAVFLAFVLLMRSVTPNQGYHLPKEAAEHLGRISLTQKVQLHLLRIGNRLVLLSVTADGATAITELTDADEVVQVLGACRRNDGKGSTAAFQQVLGGFLGGSNDGIGRGKKKTGGLNDLYTPGEDSLTGLLAAGLPIKNK